MENVRALTAPSASETRPLRIGLAGLGSAAKQCFGPALRSTRAAMLWSAHSRSIDRARRILREFGLDNTDRGFDDYEAFVTDPSLDAVIIMSPDPLHCEQAITAMRAGKHVLVEKPMAISSAQAREMAEVSRQTGKVLYVGYRCRQHHGFRKVFEGLRSNVFGPLHHIHVSWTLLDPTPQHWRCNPEFAPWRALSKLGTHMVDFCIWMAGPQAGRPVDVRANVERRVSKNDDSVTALWRFENGPSADIYVSVEHGDGQDRIELHTEYAMIECRNTLGFWGEGEIFVNGDRLLFDSELQFITELEEFCSVIQGRVREYPDGAVGLANVELLETIVQAARPSAGESRR